MRAFRARLTSDVIGRSPIPLPTLIVGKAALIGCVLFFLVKVLNADSMLHDSTVTSISGIVLYLFGVIFIIVALVHLGSSAAVGIPLRETALKTRGLYRLSRNPIYLGLFLACAGSCLYAIHPVNFLLCAITVLIHFEIVRKEEAFLEQRFGKQWIEYKTEVPRFLGLRRRS